MRATLVALGLFACAGCAEVPTADDLVWEDGGEPVGVLAYETVPDADAEQPAPPATPVIADAEPGDGPGLSVSRMRDISPDNYDYDGVALCPFSVTAKGFPAVSADGTRFAYWVSETLSSSDGEDQAGTFRIVDVATDTTLEEVVVFDGDDPSLGEAYDDGGEIAPDHCRQLREVAKENAAVVNEMLAEDAWRTMEPLDLIMRDRAMYDEDPYWADDTGEGHPLPPASERPVELVHLGKTAAYRIPGVKVLARMDADWDGPWEQWCGGYLASLDEAWVDRRTSVVTVQVGQQSGPCYCYSQTLMHAVPTTPEILDMIDARPWPPTDDA